jgi:TonB-dependent starch-binding outer membrane protein SusC
MIIKLKFAVIALLMICSQNVFSQSKTVQGVVTDNAGLPLPGVSVLEQGTKNTASTGFDGKYTLNNVASGSKLIFTFIGMNTKTVVFTGQASVNVMLAPVNEELKTIVVVGYGSQKRANVTGAISTVNAKDIAAIPVANAAQALQGRAAGVTVVNSGVPGDNPVVIIRGLGTFGSSAPTYVVDGIIVGNLSGVNPGDIENISVLKDASTAAVYGALGANGVIVVTTKKGAKGKGVLNFNAYTGVNFVTKRHDLMNTEQYLKYAKETTDEANAAANPAVNKPFVLIRPESYKTNYVDYQDALFTTGLIKDYNLSYSSGSDAGSQRFSGEYQKTEGSLINTGFERYNFRANTSHSFGKLAVGSNISLVFSKKNPELESQGRTLLEHAIKNAPYLPIYNPTNIGGFQGTNSAADGGNDAENPVRVQLITNKEQKNLGIIGSVFAEYELFSGLKFKSQVGLDYYTYRIKTFTPSFNDDNIKPIITEGQNARDFSQFNIDSGYGQAINVDNSLTYKKTFSEKHNLEVLALTSNYRSFNESLNASSKIFSSREYQQIYFDELLPVNRTADSGGPNETIRVGLLGRLNYNYDEKYLLALSIRRDASSNFGLKDRWGNFYSVALGWNIAKENFMKDTPINNLKLRGSYGTVGIDNLGAYQTETRISPNGKINGIKNPDLKWEQKTAKNIGLDLGLYNNQYTASLEVFDNVSDDLLANIDIPPIVGGGSYPANVGSVRVRGLEFNLGYNDTKGDFTWSANVNFGTSKNEIIKLGQKFNDISPLGKGVGGSIARNEVGHAIGSFYGKTMEGVYQSQEEVNNALYKLNDQGLLQTNYKSGDVRFKDVNKDGQINDDDREYLGNPFPDFTYGINLSGAYKGFDLNIFVTGVQGNKIFNTTIYDLQGQTRLFNAGTAVLDRWTTTNPSNTIPKFKGTDANVEVSNRYIEDGSFTRLKNITLGYTLPNKAFEKYLTKLRVYASAQNLITLTDYSGLDPEIAGKGASAALDQRNSPEIGIDRGVYPQPKTIIMGIELTF